MFVSKPAGVVYYLKSYWLQHISEEYQRINMNYGDI